ncbi:hypothetical protein CYMTET_34695, partial [Cymbomonas tetramitiformis]
MEPSPPNYSSSQPLRSKAKKTTLRELTGQMSLLSGAAAASRNLGAFEEPAPPTGIPDAGAKIHSPFERTGKRARLLSYQGAAEAGVQGEATDRRPPDELSSSWTQKRSFAKAELTDIPEQADNAAAPSASGALQIGPTASRTSADEAEALWNFSPPQPPKQLQQKREGKRPRQVVLLPAPPSPDARAQQTPA